MEDNILFYQQVGFWFRDELEGAGKVKDPQPNPGEYDTVGVNQLSKLVFHFLKLSEAMLIAAAMSPVPSSGAHLLTHKGKSRISPIVFIVYLFNVICVKYLTPPFF